MPLKMGNASPEQPAVQQRTPETHGTCTGLVQGLGIVSSGRDPELGDNKPTTTMHLTFSREGIFRQLGLSICVPPGPGGKSSNPDATPSALAGCDN